MISVSRCNCIFSRIVKDVFSDKTLLHRVTYSSISSFKYSGQQRKNINYNNIGLYNINPLKSLSFIRTYSKKYKNRKADEDSDDSDGEMEGDFVDKFDKNAKVAKHKLPSLRMDVVLKNAFGLSRNKIDVAFYESRIRVNGKKVLKKGCHVKVGDEIDIVKGTHQVNSRLLSVSRVELLAAKSEDEEALIVKMRKFKSLNIENYEDDPYEEIKSEV